MSKDIKNVDQLLVSIQDQIRKIETENFELMKTVTLNQNKIRNLWKFYDEAVDSNMISDFCRLSELLDTEQRSVDFLDLLRD